MPKCKPCQISTFWLEGVLTDEECLVLISAELMRKNNHYERGSDVY